MEIPKVKMDDFDDFYEAFDHFFGPRFAHVRDSFFVNWVLGYGHSGLTYTGTLTLRTLQMIAIRGLFSPITFAYLFY